MLKSGRRLPEWRSPRTMCIFVIGAKVEPFSRLSNSRSFERAADRKLEPKRSGRIFDEKCGLELKGRDSRTTIPRLPSAPCTQAGFGQGGAQGLGIGPLTAWGQHVASTLLAAGILSGNHAACATEDWRARPLQSRWAQIGGTPNVEMGRGRMCIFEVISSDGRAFCQDFAFAAPILATHPDRLAIGLRQWRHNRFTSRGTK